jgi:ketosteroid isomerase-like protein
LTSRIPEVTPAGGTSPDFARQLWDIEQIKQLKARYFRLMDTKDWDAWKELFAEDCVHHLPAEVDAPPQTNAEYLELVPRLLANAFTTHHGHMPEITLLSPTEATGVWAMFDYVLYPDRPTGIKGYGHYYETYRKGDDGRWRISSKRNQRLRVDEIPNPSWVPAPES